VLSLGSDGYTAQGDRAEAACQDCQDVIFGVLASEQAVRQSPGMNYQQIVAAGWEDVPVPRKESILAALRTGYEAGLWQREGDGIKGSPYTYWRPKTD
jgi:hypothetical protein